MVRQEQVVRGGDRALAYGNPGNLSYEDPSQARVGSNLYSPDDAATGIAIGRYSDAVTEGARTVSGIAIGDYARAVGGLGIALGGYSQATNIGSAAIGTGALASGFNSLSMMRQSAAGPMIMPWLSAMFLGQRAKAAWRWGNLPQRWAINLLPSVVRMYRRLPQ